MNIFEFQKDPKLVSVLGSNRNAALSALQKLPIPSKNLEDWRHTSVKKILNTEFNVSVDLKASLSWSAKLDANSIHILVKGGRAFVQNSRQSKDLIIKKVSLDSDFKLAFMARFAKARKAIKGNSGPSSFRREYTVNQSYFEAFNACRAPYAIYVGLKPGVRLKKPLQLHFLGEADDHQSSAQVFIEVGSGSSLQLHESIALQGSNSFSTKSLEVLMHTESEVFWSQNLNAVNEHSYFQNSRFLLKKGAVLNGVQSQVSSPWGRHQVDIHLLADSTQAHLKNVSLAFNGEHNDHHTFIDHVVPNTHSSQLYKNILSQKSRGVFNGRILIRPNAQGSTTAQTHRSLILDETCEVNSKPQLEIYADDVKAAHGATMGELNQEEIFYLQSRGISLANARALLTKAFAAEVILSVPSPIIRNEMLKSLDDRVHQIVESLSQSGGKS